MFSKIKIALLLVIFVGAAAVLLLLQQEDIQTEQNYSALQQIAGGNTASSKSAQTNSSQPTETSDQTQTEGDAGGNLQKTTVSKQSYNELKALNSDFDGWLQIPNTNLNYPVMLNKADKNYYLHRDFYGNYSSYGVPFADDRYDYGVSNNLVIYGHDMQNSMMFSQLANYRDIAYYQAHPQIFYTNVDGEAAYQIFAAFAINIDSDDFDYHNYINLNADQYQQYLSEIATRQFYDTGITPNFGDKLICLSTCINDQDDGRLVVVGVQAQN